MNFLIGLLFSAITEYITYLLVGGAFLLYWMKAPATTPYQRLLPSFAAGAALTSLLLFNGLLAKYQKPAWLLPPAAVVVAIVINLAGARLLAVGIHQYKTAKWVWKCGYKNCPGKIAGGFFFLIGLLPLGGSVLLTLSLMLSVEHATISENEVTHQAIRTEILQINNVITVAEALNAAIAAKVKSCDSVRKWVWTCGFNADTPTNARAASMQLKGLLVPLIEQEKPVEEPKNTPQQTPQKSPHAAKSNIAKASPPRRMVDRSLVEALSPLNKDKLFVALDSMRVEWLAAPPETTPPVTAGHPDNTKPVDCRRASDPFRLDVVNEVACNVQLKVSLVKALAQNEEQQRTAKLQDPQQIALLLLELLTVVMSVLAQLAAFREKATHTIEDDDDGDY